MKKLLFVLFVLSTFLVSCKKENVAPDKKSDVVTKNFDKANRGAPYIEARGDDDPPPKK